MITHEERVAIGARGWTPERKAAMARILQQRRADPEYEAKRVKAVKEAHARRKAANAMKFAGGPEPVSTAPVVESLPDTNGNGVHHAEAGAVEIKLNDGEKTRTRAFWNEGENRVVALKLASLLRKQGILSVPDSRDRTGRNLLCEFLAAAQLELPRERRRLRARPSEFTDDFFNLVQQIITTRQHVIEAPRSEAIPKINGSETTPHAVPKIAVSVSQLPEAKAPAKIELPVGFAIVNEADPLGKVPTIALAEALFSRLMKATGDGEAMRRKLDELEQMQALMLMEQQKNERTFMQRLAEMQTRLDARPANGKKVLPRVAILGCRAYEFNHIREACAAAELDLDFRHYDQDSKPRAVDAEWAITLKWADHAWRDQVRAAIPADRHKFINGGIGMAVSQLKAWFQT